MAEQPRRPELINCSVMLATYVNVLSQQVVGSLVLFKKIAVGGAAGEEATEEETEESGRKVSDPNPF